MSITDKLLDFVCDPFGKIRKQDEADMKALLQRLDKEAEIFNAELEATIKKESALIRRNAELLKKLCTNEGE